jgi:tRNA(His) guanylyltransferase
VIGDELEARMRQLEWFHSLAVLPGTWPIIRVDGRSFTQLVEQHFERPFDARFHDFMLETAEALLVELGGVFAYTESDEISVAMPADTQLFGRELEKLVSISAGVASSVFSLRLGQRAHFDSRVWVGPSVSHVLDYFRWRQSDAARCALNVWCYWSLRKEGHTAQRATAALEGKSFSDKNELLFQRGVNFNDVPSWQRHGVALYYDEVEKVGFNPVTREPTTTRRRRLRVDEQLPRGDDFGELVRRVLTST